MSWGIGAAPGTWGELIQGVDRRGRHQLVSLPSRDGSRALVRLLPRRRGSPPVLAAPPWRRAAAAVALLLDELGLGDVQARLSVHSALPRGLGRASSSADLLAALSATCRALRRPLRPAALCALACRIEPTNPTILPGWSLYRQRRGEHLGSARPLPLTLRPLPGSRAVDTRAWHREAPPWTTPQLRAHARSLALLERGIALRDPRRIAAAATRSALLTAERRGRSEVPRALELARERGALGLALSHSGSYMVAIFPPGVPRERRSLPL